MKDRGIRNLIILLIFIGVSLLSFYGFLGYRARIWSPRWAISPSAKAYPILHSEASQFQPQFESEADSSVSSVEGGRLLYRQLRCGVCHGPNGEGGVKNPNADPDGVVPNLFDLSDAFTPNDLKDKVMKGFHPAKLEADKPAPPLDMPAWEKALSDEEAETLNHYLFSLKSPAETDNADSADNNNKSRENNESESEKNWDWNSLKAMSLIVNKIGVTLKPKEQPAPFSHKAHANFGIACDSCHIGAKDEVKTSIPNVQICAFCHVPDKLTPPTPKSLEKYIRDMKEIPWQKVYQNPQHVRFSHKRHVKEAGLNCKACHGDVAHTEKALVGQLLPFNMNSCLSCHKQEKVTTDCLACHR